MWLLALLLAFLRYAVFAAAAFASRPPPDSTEDMMLLRRSCLGCFCGGRRGQATQRAHALPLGALGQATPTSHSSSGRTLATSPSPPFSALQDDLKAILSTRLVPVPRIDVDAERFLTPANFRNFVLARFDIGTLEAQGEESMVRRIVHAHLVGPEAEDPLYLQLLVSLSSLPDPWAAASDQSMFQPEMARITTSSQRNSHLVAATTGRAGIAKALQQLSANLETLRAEESKNSKKDDAPDLLTLRDKIRDRQARVEEMDGKLARFDALIQVLAAIEDWLASTKDRVIKAQRRWRQSAPNGGSSSSSSSSNNGKQSAASNDVRRNSQAWGKAVEKEGKEALEACLEEWKQQQQQQQTTTNDNLFPFILTGVTLQSLDSEAMLTLRQDIVKQHAPIYDGTDWPKAELDALIVAPTPEDPHRLQVALAIEMKRSLDEVSVDCLKFHLSLELCRQAPLGAIRFSSSSSSSLHSSGVVKTNKQGKGEPSAYSTDNGFILDFSSLRLPDDAIYMTKRGGSTLRAATKLLLEQVQLARTDNNGSSSSSSSSKGSEEEEVLRRFYAPDFVSLSVEEDDDDAGGRGAAAAAAAEQEREAVLDALYQRFSTQGIERLRRRLDGVVTVLTGQPLADRGEAPRLRSVLALQKDLSA